MNDQLPPTIPNDMTDSVKDPSMMYPIAAIADDQEHMVKLPNTIHDPLLPKSLITKHKAFATQGRIKSTNPITLTTSGHHCYSTSSAITLRWRYNAGMQSYQETFYIVDGIDGEYDAILRKDIERIDREDGKAKPSAFPLMLGKHDKKGREDMDKKKQLRADRDEEYQRQMEQERRTMKERMIKGR
jgi:hypothetical protein